MSYRENVLAYLDRLSCLDPLLGPVEAVCMWFDDLFPDGSPVVTEFSEAEVESLVKFDKFFSKVVDQLGDHVDFSVDMDIWCDVAQHARIAKDSVSRRRAN